MAPRETFKSLRKKIQGTIQETLGSEFSQKLQTQLSEKLQEKFGDRWTQSAQKISQATHLATETAKFGFQQALQQLEQRGFDVHDPKAFAQSVGKKALVEAERIRLAVAENPLSPAWLRDVTFTPVKPSPQAEEGEVQEMKETSPVEATASGSIVESVMSEAAEGMQPGHGALNEERIEETPEAVEDDASSRADEEDAKPKKRKSSRSTKGSGSTRLSH